MKKKLVLLIIWGHMCLTACTGQTFDQAKQNKGEQDDNKTKSVSYICEEKRTEIENIEIESVTIGGQKVGIKKEILEIDGSVDRRHIEYPYLDSDNDIAQLINEQIYDLIDRECLRDSEYTIYEDITYETMVSDDQILSIHFTGYRGVAASYADFDMALNFEMDTGEILTLQSFYTLSEMRQLIDVAMTEKKISVVNIPLNEDEMQDYINQYFKKVFSNDSYIRRSDNFFVKDGNLYFIAESYPSLRQYTYVEWKDGIRKETENCFRQQDYEYYFGMIGVDETMG